MTLLRLKTAALLLVLGGCSMLPPQEPEGSVATFFANDAMRQSFAFDNNPRLEIGRAHV